MNTVKKALVKVSLLILVLSLFSSCKKDKKDDETIPVVKENPLAISYDFSYNLEDGSDNNLDLLSTASLNYSFTSDRNSNNNSAIQLTGNGFLQLPASAKYKPDFPFTVSMWVYLDDATSANNRIFYSDDNSIYYGFWIQSTGSSGALAFNFGDGTGASEDSRNSVISSTTLSNNTWTHIAAVFKGANNIEIYIDGEKDNGVTYSGYATEINYSNVAGVIGKAGGSNSFLNGRIDKVKIWKEARTETQINAEYTSSN